MTDADLLTRMLHAVDRLDWATVRDCYAGQVRVDYTSLWGGEPATVAIGDLIGQWQEMFKGFGATQHLTGPLCVTGDLVETHVTAHHWRASGTAWVVHGHYAARFDGGRITELTLHVFHAGGDPDLPSIPAQRPLPLHAGRRRTFRASWPAGIQRSGQAGSGKTSRAVIVMVSEPAGVTTSERAHTM